MRVLAILGAIFALASSAHAGPITYAFSGTWATANSFGMAGQNYSGTFIFDDDASLIDVQMGPTPPFGDPDVNVMEPYSRARYDASQMSWAMNSGSQAFSGSGGIVYIDNTPAGALGSDYWRWMTTIDQTGGDMLYGLSAFLGGAFNGYDLVAPDPTRFTDSWIGVDQSAHQTTISRVPEPGSALLLSVGSLLVILRRRQSTLRGPRRSS